MGISYALNLSMSRLGQQKRQEYKQGHSTTSISSKKIGAWDLGSDTSRGHYAEITTIFLLRNSKSTENKVNVMVKLK